MRAFLSKIHLPEEIRNGGPFSIFALAVFFIPIIFSLYTYENFETVKLPALIFFCGCLLISLARQNNWSFPKNPTLFYLLGSLLSLSFISSLFAKDKVYSFLGLYPRLNNSFLIYFIWAVFILAGLIFLNKARTSLLIKIICLVGGIIAVTALIQNTGIGFYVSPEASISNPNPRVPGLLGNPNFTSMYLVMVLPFLLYKFFAQNNRKFSQLVYGTVLFLAILTILILTSRGALIGLGAIFASFLVYFVALKKQKEFIWLLLICIITSVLGYTFLNVYRGDSFGKAQTISATNVSTRITAWNQSIKIIEANPILGVGPGNFHLAYEKFGSGDSLVESSGSFDDAHNVLLQLAATSGIPFLFVFLLLLFLLMLRAFKIFIRQKDLLAGTLASVILSFLVVGSFTPVPIAAWLLLAVTLSAIWAIDEEKTIIINVGKLAKPFWRIAGALFVVYALAFLLSEYLFYFGLHSYVAKNYRSSYVYSKAALVMNPANQYAAVYRAAAAGRLGVPAYLVSDYIKYSENLHPFTGRTYHQSGSLYWQLYTRTEDLKYAQMAVDSVRKSIGLNGLVPERNGELAYYFQSAGNVDLALYYARRQLVLSPSLVGGWIMLAKLYQTKGMWPEEKYAIMKAFEIEPSAAQIRNLWHQAKNGDGKGINIEVLQTENYLD